MIGCRALLCYWKVNICELGLSAHLRCALGVSAKSQRFLRSKLLTEEKATPGCSGRGDVVTACSHHISNEMINKYVVSALGDLHSSMWDSDKPFAALYLSRIGYVFISVCVSVSAGSLRKLLKWIFFLNLVGGWDMSQRRTHYILARIRTKGPIQEFLTSLSLPFHFWSFSPVSQGIIHGSWWKKIWYI